MRVGTVDGDAVLEVCDQGPGLSAEDAHRIFERHVTSGAGTGRGLALARQLEDLTRNAGKHAGGVVIAQVERIAERGTLHPRQVKVPGVLVDAVVLAQAPAHHQQTFAEPYSAAFAGELRVPMDMLTPMPL